MLTRLGMGRIFWIGWKIKNDNKEKHDAIICLGFSDADLKRALRILRL